MKTRAVLVLSALLASGLAVGAADAAVRKPAPKPTTPVCPSFTDAAKDDLNGDTAKGGVNAEDPTLDIVKTTESVKGGIVTIAIQVTKLGDPSVADGVQYAGGFTAGGKAVELFGTLSRTSPVVGAAFAINGINVDGSYVSGSSKKVALASDPASNTVRLTATLADIEAAVGSKIGGSLVGGLQSNTAGTFGVLIEPYDDSAPATAAVKLKAADCK